MGRVNTKVKGQKQHYVPEVYLRKFSDSFGYFYKANIEHVIKYKKKKVYPVNTGQVCYLPDYYDVDQDELKGIPRLGSKFLETYGFRYESHLSHCLDIFKNRKLYILKDELSILIDAYLSIKQRNRYVREKFFGSKLIMEKLLDKAMEETLINPIINYFVNVKGFDVDRFHKNFKTEYFDNPRREEIAHKELLMTSALGISKARQETSNNILCNEFYVLEAGANDYFFVMDNPGFTLKEIDSKLQTFNTDFKDFYLIVIPLNSKQVLLIDGNIQNKNNLINPLRRINYMQASSKMVMEINRGLVFVINSTIFCENQNYLRSFITGSEFSRLEDL
jgi:hypothetical protein